MCDRQEELAAEFIKDEACLKAHELLTACMAEHNRSWSKCQVRSCLKLSRRRVRFKAGMASKRRESHLIDCFAFHRMQAQVKLLKACRDMGADRVPIPTTLRKASTFSNSVHVASGDAPPASKE
jgi:hypothetical protein